MKTSSPCVVSDVYRFIFVCIAKNASSTLKKLLQSNDYRGRLLNRNQIESDKWDRYFTFAFLRDPVVRILSAYQELSLRYDRKPVQEQEFYRLAEGPERFESFLAEVERRKWDNHVADQVGFLEEVKVDFLGSVENLERDMNRICVRLSMPTAAGLPVQRSRRERRDVHGYGNHYVLEEDLSDELRDRICKLYEDDVRLHGTIRKEGLFLEQ